MEILVIIIGVIVILLAIRSQKNEIFDRLDELEKSVRNLQKTLSKPQPQSVNKTEEPSFAGVPQKESSDREKHIPAYAQKEVSVISAIPQEKPVIPIVKKEEIEPKPEKPIAAPVKKEPVFQKEKRDFEKFIGENLLSKIGIITLVLGIAYFVKYAIDQNWINEIGRVAIGVLIGGIVIAIAHKLKNTYRTFSSILVGGGISILYITITIAFREYQLFSQTLSFVVLIFITVFSVFLSILYDRKELAIFSLLGGFASPLLVSSGTGNYVVLLSYILILNTGMLILTFKRQWKVVGIISYTLTQLFYWLWLMNSFVNEKFGATAFIFLFFVQFYLLVLIDHYKSERKITPFQIITILSNNLSLFAATIYIFNDNPVNVKGVITIAIAALNAIPMILLFQDKKIDKQLIYLLIAVVLTFVSLAVPIQLNGCAITMFWAAETVILLWLWQKSEIKIFKYGFIAIELLVIISLLMYWSHFYAKGIQTMPVIFNKPFITGLVITATVWMNAYLLKKETDKEFLPGLTFNLSRWFSFAGIIFLFFTLFWELQYQMNQYYHEQGHFRKIIYGLYCYTFISVLTIIQWNKEHWKKTLYGILAGFSALYVVSYTVIVHALREDVVSGISQWGYFAMHYLALPSVALLFTFLLKKKKEVLNKEHQHFIYWFTAIISVIILSVETDNLMLMSFFNGSNEYALLKLSHNIIYPILWGIASFALMAIGMKQKNRALRVISLSLFALIIAKLYLHDVWKMEQTWRIIAFIFLGIVLLTVSFLYQKLKILLMKNEENEKKEVE